MDKTVAFKPIGTIHSPFSDPKGTPIQPTAAVDVRGTVEVFDEYLPGLKDLDGFSHIILICHMHRAGKPRLLVKPFMDDMLRGVFAVRAPSRPNSIGLSVVRLDRIEGNMLYIRDVDLIDGTPLLDIKPFVPEFDHRKVTRTGWLQENIRRLNEITDDGRFAE
jgi:tRNA-Thr(GGU) m(6)t(6)A37 methyltransferase TsaA